MIDLRDRCLQLAEDIVHDSVGLCVTASNPDEYTISSELYDRAVKLYEEIG